MNVRKERQMKKNQFSLQDETTAMKNIAAELEKLPQDSQQRIVKWLLSIVGNLTQSGNVIQSSEKNLPASVNVIGPSYQKEEVKEFFQSKQPKNYYQKLAVLGYYLEFMKGKDEFSAQDLKIAWKQTREALPSHQVFSTSLNATISIYNYFVSGQKRGLYRIGVKGQKLVETLPEQPKGLAGSAKKRKKKASSTKKEIS